MNSEILGAMLRQGCCHFNFEYVLAIMETVIEEEVQPSEKFLDHLENFHKVCERKIRNKVGRISAPKDLNLHLWNGLFLTVIKYGNFH
jgi:hypothetical protein